MSTSADQSKTGMSMGVKIGIGVVVVILLAAGGYYFYKQKAIGPPIVDEPTPALPPQATLEEDDTTIGTTQPTPTPTQPAPTPTPTPTPTQPAPTPTQPAPTQPTSTPTQPAPTQPTPTPTPSLPTVLPVCNEPQLSYYKVTTKMMKGKDIKAQLSAKATTESFYFYGPLDKPIINTSLLSPSVLYYTGTLKPGIFTITPALYGGIPCNEPTTAYSDIPL